MAQKLSPPTGWRPATRMLTAILFDLWIKLDFALQLAARVTSSPDLNLTSFLSTSPQTIINPISYTIVNLIPFNQPVASAVAFVGLIYCLILSFFVVMVAYGAREASGVNRILGLKSLIIVRLTTSFLGYFFLSLFYSLLSLAFKLDFTRRYGHSGFFLFWMLNYFGMLSVGLALESLITIFTATWIPYFQMLWIIANVSVCVFPIEILPGIFHYGYATPFYNLSISIRSIAFGTKNTLGASFGILILWVAISSMTLPLLQWFATTELAATYAALILADDGIEITSDKILALTNAAGVELEPIWASLLAKALEGKNVKELLSNVGSGGGAPAAGAPAAAAGGAAAAEAPKEEEKEEEKEESDDDMGFGLFD
ncbi:hypothetical protein NLJ89_g10854 [Agrocybe chaxingu]|uniref:DUF3533 domain-containing protein n=1 Tax=Agrocybe chaxingu TaxID=84603 RepID=A0A9W8MS73_9AGAR|nr:hypothetical protein NLJ89_g10854 [Agrocybe chaxingu]